MLFVVTFLLSTLDSNAQLYSSGNNTIEGDNVGIGNKNPTAALVVTPPNTSTHPLLVQRFYKTKSGLSIPTTALVIKNDSSLIGLHTANPKYAFHLTGSGYASGNFYVQKRLGIGTTEPLASLHIKGTSLFEGTVSVSTLEALGGETNIKLNGITGQIRCREVKVDLQPIPDYVFTENYELMPLAELRTFVNTHKHLPNIKSEAEYQEEGSIGLTEMNLKLLEKVEELTLYILELEERIGELEK